MVIRHCVKELLAKNSVTRPEIHSRCLFFRITLILLALKAIIGIQNQYIWLHFIPQIHLYIMHVDLNNLLER